MRDRETRRGVILALNSVFNCCRSTERAMGDALADKWEFESSLEGRNKIDTKEGSGGLCRKDIPGRECRMSQGVAF